MVRGFLCLDRWCRHSRRGSRCAAHSSLCWGTRGRLRGRTGRDGPELFPASRVSCCRTQSSPCEGRLEKGANRTRGLNFFPQGRGQGARRLQAGGLSDYRPPVLHRITMGTFPSTLNHVYFPCLGSKLGRDKSGSRGPANLALEPFFSSQA